MTEEQAKNIEELMAKVDRYSPELLYLPEPLRFSVAKYYPVLKRLVEE